MIDQAIARIEAALRKLGSHLEPPPGWQQRVLDRVKPGGPSRGWWAVPAAALAAALGYALPSTTPQLALVVDHELRGPPRRTGAPSIGDHLRIRVTGGAGTRTLWLYHNERRVVARCPGAACEVTARGLTVDFEIDALGRFTVVALSAAAPLPPPSGSYDLDVTAANAAGATIKTYALDVR